MLSPEARNRNTAPFSWTARRRSIIAGLENEIPPA
jgi:hypothetical protein